LKELHPLVRVLCINLVKTCEMQGIELQPYIPETNKGVYNVCNWGLAFKVQFKKKYKKYPWEQIGKIARTLGLDWGGNFDPPMNDHLQSLVYCTFYGVTKKVWFKMLSNSFIIGGKKEVWQVIDAMKKVV
jgi:hypothetical protein